MHPTAPLPAGGVAWADPATRRVIHRHGLKAILEVLGGVVLIVVAVTLVRASQAEADAADDRWDEIGVDTVGVVVDASEGIVDDHIDVRFVVDGVEHTGRVRIDSKYTGVFDVGDEIPITYDPEDPSNIRSLFVKDEETGWRFWVAGPAGLMGVIFVLISPITILNSLRWQSLAKREPWRCEPIVYTRKPLRAGGGRFITGLVLCRPNGPDPRVCGVYHGGRRARGLADSGKAWLLGDPSPRAPFGELSTRALIAIPGPKAVFATTGPSSRHQEDGWLKVFGRDDLVPPT